MKNLIVLVLLGLITFALADGIRSGSIMGILLATCSLIALGYALYLMKNLNKEPVEVEDDTYPS